MATSPMPMPQGQGGGAPSGAPSPGGPSNGSGPSGSPAIKLAMLGQAIQSLSREFPQGAQFIQQMLTALRGLQSSASAQSAPQQPPTGPRPA
jgi:hypothetical protein